MNAKLVPVGIDSLEVPGSALVALARALQKAEDAAFDVASEKIYKSLPDHEKSSYSLDGPTAAKVESDPTYLKIKELRESAYRAAYASGELVSTID